METFKKELSASVNGTRIAVAQTATVGTLCHTGPSRTDQYDEVFLYADNTSEAAVVLSVEFGTVTKPIEISLAANTAGVLVTPGLVLRGAATPLVIGAFAGTANVVNIGGYVNRVAK